MSVQFLLGLELVLQRDKGVNVNHSVEKHHLFLSFLQWMEMAYANISPNL